MTAARLACVVLLAAACSSRAAVPEEGPVKPPAPDASSCLETLRVEHGQSVLEEQRRVGPHAWDFQERYDTAAIDPATYTPVQATAAFTIDGRPLLWFTPDKTVAVLDSARFSPLAVADATRLGDGERVTLGRFLTAGALDGRTLARFLVAAGVIRVYAHIGADVCLEREGTVDGAYELVVSGVHTYFTNSRNDVPFRFVFRVAADGTMSVEGRPAR